MKKARGGREFSRHMLGERLTTKQAIEAKCFECTGGYIDGRIDCEIKSCPLYPYSPYGTNPAPKVNKGHRARRAKTLLEVFTEESPTEEL